MVGNSGDLDTSQDIPGYRFHNADDHVEHGKGGKSGTGDWECRFFGLVQRDWYAEKRIVRGRASKSVEVDGNRGGNDVCDRRKAPSELYVASEELDEEVGGDDEEEDHHGTCWIA